jgi:uncharacterized membrane protein
MMFPVANALDMTAFAKVADPIIVNIVYPLIEGIFAVAVLVFAYGVLQMVLHRDDAEARKKGQWSIFGGVVGMFIMVSAWGIVYVISNTVKGI